MEMEVEGPSLPSNYVTILQLKERWLQQHHQNPQLPKSNHESEGDSRLNPKPNHEPALKRLPPRNPRPNHHQNPASKTQVDVADNHPKGEKEEHHSNSKLAKKKKDSTTRKPSCVTDQNPNGGGTPLLEPEPLEEKKPAKERWLQLHHQNPAPPQLPKSKRDDDEGDSQLNPKPNDDAALKRVPPRNCYNPRPNHHQNPASKTQVDIADSHPKGEKEEYKTDHSNSKLAKKIKGSTARKPRFVTDQNPNGGSTPLLEPESVEEKKQAGHIGGRRSQNQKVVRESKDKTAPLAQNVDHLSHDDVRGDNVVEAVAAAVKESNVPSVSEGTNRRGGFSSFHGKPKPKPKPKPGSWSDRPSKPLFLGKKAQTSLVWVKKGESAAN